MNKRKDIVPNNLKEYRLKAGLTQKEVAKRLGFTNDVAISHWEHGKNIPNLLNLIKLIRLYNAPLELLYAPQITAMSEQSTENYTPRQD